MKLLSAGELKDIMLVVVVSTAILLAAAVGCSALILTLRGLFSKKHHSKFKIDLPDHTRLILGAIYLNLAIALILFAGKTNQTSMQLKEWSLLLLVSTIDLLYFWVPSELLILSAILHVLLPGWNWADSLIGAASALAIGFVVYMLAEKRYSGGNSAFGFGDATFCMLIGWIAGFQTGLSGIALGMILGGITAGLLLLSGKQRTSTIALTPFFTIGLILYQNFSGG